MLERTEYIEQAYMFQALGERLPRNIPIQTVLEQVREETLATTRLPLAVDYLLAELRHSGTMNPAMQQLGHYFSPFQTYLVREAENERGRFDMRLAVEILHREALYRAEEGSPQGLFLFQFETLCRNRLQYDPGLLAISKDPFFDAAWREWILIVRRQVGLIDFADLLFLRSEHRESRATSESDEEPSPILFGVREGKIAIANRQKDPLFLFAALQRQLDYPEVPRPEPIDDSPQRILQMSRSLEQLTQRVKLLEDEQRGGIDLEKYYSGPLPGSSRRSGTGEL